MVEEGKHTELKELTEHLCKKTEEDDEGEKCVDQVEEATLVDTQNSEGISPLNLAVAKKDATSVEILIHARAKIQEDSSGKLATLIAVENQDSNCLNILVKSLKISESDHKELCLIAANNQDSRCLEILLQRSTIPESDHEELGQIAARNQELCDLAIRQNNPGSVLLIQQLGVTAITFTTDRMGKEDGSGEKIKEFNFSSPGQSIKRVTVNTGKWGDSLKVVAGLQLQWSNDSRDSIGLTEEDEDTVNTTITTAPGTGHFSFVRGQIGGNVVWSLTFDTVKDEDNTVIRGKRSEGSDRGDTVHTISALDIENSPLHCELTGVAGEQWKYGDGDKYLTHLVFTYTISHRDTEAV